MRQRIWIADELMEAAEAATGLSDWGEEDVRRPFEVLCYSLEHEGQLHAAGVELMKTRLSGVLASRLRVIDYRKQDSWVAQQRIERPLIVLGLPRSGTSHMHGLLAADPAVRSPRVWEMAIPVPPPRKETYTSDPRIEQMGAAMKASGFLTQEFISIHPFSHDEPEECGQILEYTGCAGMYSALCWIPTFTRFRENVDFRAAMRFHKKFLQHLQTYCAGERWVLKSAEYHYHIEEILDVYPDACIVMTHRDPARTLTSEVSLYRVMRRLTTEGRQYTNADAGRAVLESNALSVERFMDLRKRLGRDPRILDVHYRDLVANPMPLVERIHAHFGLTLTDQARAAMQRYLQSHAQNRHGVHRYSLHDWGLTERDIEDHFARYIDAVGIEREARI